MIKLGVVAAPDACDRGHGIGGRSLDAVIGAAGVDVKVITRPGHMVPGHDAVEGAGGKVVCWC